MDSSFICAARKVTEATNIGNLCSALAKCRNMLGLRLVNRNSLLEYLRKVLVEKVLFIDAGSRLKGFPINTAGLYKDTDACLAYLAFKAGYCRDAADLCGEMDSFISFFYNRTTEPRTAVLAEEEIYGLLELLQCEYNFVEALTYEKRLEIYLINRSHVGYDSWLTTFKNIHTGKWINRWMVMSFAPLSDTTLCGKQFVFLHEMGHILYDEINRGDGSMPLMFKELLTAMSGMSMVPTGLMLHEVFADLFAAASMNNSRYAGLNPYAAILPEELMRLLQEYFRLIISRVGSSSNATATSMMLH